MLMLLLFSGAISGQSVLDTAVVPIGKESMIIVAISDHEDPEMLRRYDYNAMFADIISHFYPADSIAQDVSSTQPATTDVQAGDEMDYGGYNWYDGKPGKGRYRKIRHFINADIGINGLGLESFVNRPDDPDNLFFLKSWGSWNVSLNSVWKAKLSDNARLEWGTGVSWYNFKLQDPKDRFTTDYFGVAILPHPDNNIDRFVKSKLTVAYVNAYVIPMFGFGRYRDMDNVVKTYRRMFRAGVGPYIGYRLASYTKQRYYDGEDYHNEKHHDRFFLENLRYGVRFQFGIDDTDWYFQVDLNSMFIEDRGPKVNAWSFGMVF